MPRPPRHDFPDARHHVMNRGVRRRPVFLDEQDAEVVLSVLAELPSRFGVDVHGWAIMPNHYHLMLHSRTGRISDAMRFFGAEVTRGVNLRHGWDGPMFRGRFRNRLVLDEAYWRHLLAYLHLNPIRGGISTTADVGSWTSHAAYCRRRDAPRWLVRDELFALYGTPAAYRGYMTGLVSGRSVLPDDFDEGLLWHPAISEAVHPELRCSIKPPSIADGLAHVAVVVGCSVEEVVQKVRGPKGNPARRLAAWWLVGCTGWSRRRVGEALGLKPSAVGRLASAARNDASEPMVSWRRQLSERFPGWTAD
jgi:putative transposase